MIKKSRFLSFFLISILLLFHLILIPQLDAPALKEPPKKDLISPDPSPESEPISTISRKVDFSTKLDKEKGVLELSRWDGDGKLKIKMPDEVKSYEQITKKENKFTYDDYELNIYPLNDGIEYEIILHNKPGTNIFHINISSQDLEFLYQGPLTDYDYPAGWTITETSAYDPTGKLIDYRPPEIVGSYAVYHIGKQNNQYKTGKFCHITRPKVISSDIITREVFVNETYSYFVKEKDWIWADLHYDESWSSFTITVDPDWLAKATYPVTIDPWFGYRVKGATETLISDTIRATSYSNTYTMTVRGVVAYLKYNSEADIEYAVYNATDNTLMGNTKDWESAVGWDGWKKLDADPEFNVISQDYYLALWTSSNTYMYYDSGGATAKYHDRVYDGNWPNPITWTAWADRKISIYVDNLTLAAIPINVAAGIVNSEGCGDWVFMGGTLYDFKATYLCVDGADQIIETGIGFYDGLDDWYAVYYNLTSEETSIISPESGIRAMQSNYTSIGDTLTVDYWIMFDPPIADVLNTPIYMYSMTNTTSTGWETPLAAAPGAGVSGFGFFKTVTANSLYIDSDLSDETVLVHLDATFEWDHVQNDGDDIRFIDVNGTALTYELERWNHTNEADIWVRIPTLTSEVDTMFIMFYGNPTAVSASDPGNTWHHDYVMVQHLDDWVKTSNDNRTDVAMGDIEDSTFNGNNGDLFWVSQTQLMGWYAFEDGNTSPTVTDLSVMGNTGTWNGKAVGDHNVSLSYDGLDEAGYFDGVNDYFDLGNGASLMVNDTLTLETWINIDEIETAANTWDGIVGNLGYPNDGYGLIVGSTALSRAIHFAIATGGGVGGWRTVNFDTIPQEGVWYHLAAVFTGTGMNVYLNGRPDGSTTFAATTIKHPARNNVYIGRYGANYFNGTIDSVRIYNRTLSSQEIYRHYRQWMTDSQIDGGLRTDGRDDYVEVPNDSTLNPVNRITLEAWINYRGGGGSGALLWQYPLTKYESGVPDQYKITIQGSIPRIHVQINTTAGAVNSPTHDFSMDQWYYVVGVYDGSAVRLYINGTEIGTGTVQAGTMVDNGRELIIGAHRSNYGWFNGTLDEIRISNTSKSSAEIRMHYYSGIDQLLTLGVERAVIATTSFNIYNEGGQTEYETHGDAFRIAGGSVYDLAAQNSSIAPGGSWARGNVTYRKFQHIRILFHWVDSSSWDAAQSHWDCPSEHRNTGYVEYGVDYCHNDTWMEGWKCHMEVIDGRAGQGFVSDAAWVMLNVSWYNRGILVKSDSITAYYESYRAQDNQTKFSLHVDLWVDRENASSMVGGRVNAEYFGMVNRAWFGALWEPKKSQTEKSFFQDDLVGYGYRTISAKDITLFKIWAKINKTSPDAGVPTCDSHQWAITEYEARQFQWCYADEPMHGISEPIYTQTQDITKATQNMFAALVSALVDGITRPLQQVLYETAPSAGRTFIEILRSTFQNLGDRTGLTQIKAWRNMAVIFFDYMGTSITHYTNLVVSIFEFFAVSATFIISWFVRITNTFITIIKVVNNLFTGTAVVIGKTTFNIYTGVGNIWTLLDINNWIDAIPIFMIIAWFLSIDNRAKTFGGWVSIFWGDLQIIISVASFLMDMFMTLINVIIDVAFKLFDRIPFTE